ncbi:MAG: hypothetical protein NT062_30265 [Proteobacteria bacterium]|nr:hypothetical protein [Pseudomonadota bacterium]
MRKFAIVALLAACSQDAPAVPDAANPPPADATKMDAPGCGLAYGGEYLDWDSLAATPTGVGGATLTVRTDQTRTATTAATTGAFAMCIPDGNFAVIDVVPPVGYLPGLAFAKHDVIRRGAPSSMRAMTEAQRDAAFATLAVAFDPSKGNLLVHFPGGVAHKATIDHLAAGSLARNADAWAVGDTGSYVFFGNVDLGSTANTVVSSDAAGVVGVAPIPLVGGTISYVELFVP